MKKIRYVLAFFFLCSLSSVFLGCGGEGVENAPCFTPNLECESSDRGSGYCRYGNSCAYMSVNECYNYYGGTNYGNDANCGFYVYPSSSSNGGVVVSNCNANFRTVTIGTQTWMAENLNCDVAGSKCYNNQTSNCTTYGRLYDWATAMALPSSCNSTSCSGQIQSRHKGICPSGWNIPSNAEWDILYRYADGTSGTESPYDSPTAGRYLKATSGWSSCGPSGSGSSYLCEDAFGFSALPGGNGYSDGSFNNVGNNGSWWSDSENENTSDYA